MEVNVPDQILFELALLKHKMTGKPIPEIMLTRADVLEFLRLCVIVCNQEYLKPKPPPDTIVMDKSNEADNKTNEQNTKTHN